MSTPPHDPDHARAAARGRGTLVPDPVAGLGAKFLAGVAGGGALLLGRKLYLKKQPAQPQTQPPPLRSVSSSTPQTPSSKYPAAGLRVVEMATVVAAPVVGRSLADWGAEVIKVEAPVGDMLRDKIPPLPVDQNPSQREFTAGFDYFNLGKASVQIDVKTATGKEALWALLAGADVFLTNTRPTALEKLGFGWEAVRRRCPRLRRRSDARAT